MATDAFVIAIRLPALLRLVTSGGGLAAAFIPVFSSWRVEKGETEAWDFARKSFWTVALIATGITVLGLIFTPQIVWLFTFMSPPGTDWSLAISLTRITFPFVLTVSLGALTAAALNSVGVFGIPAAVSIFLNFSIIGAGGLAWYMGSAQPAIYLAAGYMIGGAIQLAILLPTVVRRGMPIGIRIDVNHPAIRRVCTLMVPALASIGFYQINVVVSTVFASSSEGWISALFYANRLSDLIMGVVVISVTTAALPMLSQQAAEGRLDEMRGTLGFALRNVSFVVIPAAAGLIILREPIVRVLFEHRAFNSDSTALTAWPLLFYALGLPAVAGVRVLIQGFFAVQDTRSPAIGAGVALVANVVLCAVLVSPLGHGGLALAPAIASYMNFVVIYLLFRRKEGRLEERRLLASVAKSMLAAAVMSAGCWYLLQTPMLDFSNSFLELAAGLAVAILAGVLLYAAAAWALRSEELRGIIRLMAGTGLGAAPATGPSVIPDSTRLE